MGKFVVRKVPTGIDFVLKAANGEIIATSQVYSSEAACLKGIHSMQHNAPISGVEDQTVESFEVLKHPKFQLYKDKADKFRFRLLASNGENIGISQSYTTKEACEKGIHSVKTNAPDATVDHQENE
jgi:uncharacterized protein YegP (UPF0339 family)